MLGALDVGVREFVHKYNGRAVHTETVMATGPDGRRVAKPVITIYEVRP